MKHRAGVMMTFPPAAFHTSISNLCHLPPSHDNNVKLRGDVPDGSDVGVGVYLGVD